LVEPVGLAGDAPCLGCGRLLWFLRKPVGDVTVLRFLPGLIAGSDCLGRVDEVMAAAGMPPRLVVDLAHLRFISSLFLALMVQLHVKVLAAGGTMKICGLNIINIGIIRLTYLDALFSTYDDELSALASFSSS
jgi:anti-anti-sigma factor